MQTLTGRKTSIAISRDIAFSNPALIDHYVNDQGIADTHLQGVLRQHWNAIPHNSMKRLLANTDHALNLVQVYTRSIQSSDHYQVTQEQVKQQFDFANDAALLDALNDPKKTILLDMYHQKINESPLIQQWQHDANQHLIEVELSYNVLQDLMADQVLKHRLDAATASKITHAIQQDFDGLNLSAGQAAPLLIDDQEPLSVRLNTIQQAISQLNNHVLTSAQQIVITEQKQDQSTPNLASVDSFNP